MRYVILVLLLIYVTSAYSTAIYETTNQNGNISYTDSPSPGAIKIEVVPENSISTQSPASQSKDQPEQRKLSTENINIMNDTHKLYTEFIITSPNDQETFQNQRDITVTMRTNPPLQKNDKIQLFVDGVPYGEPQALTEQHLLQVNRGSHVIYAALLDQNNQILKKSNTLTIYIHYASANGSD